MFELGGVPEDVALEALRRAAMKLPMRCKIVSREVTGIAVGSSSTATAGD
jgi:large subunit ribosomal protein L16